MRSTTRRDVDRYRQANSNRESGREPDDDPARLIAEAEEQVLLGEASEGRQVEVTALIEYGLTTDVLGTAWKAEMFPLDHLPAEAQEAWWQRTDYGWRCSRCPTAAGVNYKTNAGAERSANKHAADHSGATVVAL